MKIDVDGIEEAKAAVDGLEAALLDKPALHKAIANAAVPIVRLHLMDRDGKIKHRPGWPRTGYWNKAAESTRAESDDSAAWVTVGGGDAAGVGLHLRGGTVKSSRPGGKMALPLRAELFDMNPRERFPSRSDAFVVSSKGRGPSGRAFLAYKEGGALRLAYLLLSSVEIHADSTVLPPADRLAEAARKACASYVRKAAREAAREGGK